MEVKVTSSYVIAFSQEYKIEVREYTEILKDILEDLGEEVTDDNLKKLMLKLVNADELELEFEKRRDSIESLG